MNTEELKLRAMTSRASAMRWVEEAREGRVAKKTFDRGVLASFDPPFLLPKRALIISPRLCLAQAKRALLWGTIKQDQTRRLRQSQCSIVIY